MFTNRILVICGPTASGKSALAIAHAHQENGLIINADATQMYTELRILSARPSLEDEAGIPHLLYGAWKGDMPGSAGIWVNAASAAIAQAWESGKTPIIVGGTGLYIKSLMYGLSPIPAIPAEVQHSTRNGVAASGVEAAYAELQRIDPAGAAILKPTDTQRITRALEVYNATEKPLSYWQTVPPCPPFPNAEYSVIKTELSREALYAQCNARFVHMVENGAIEEVRTLLSLGYNAALPIMRAVGVRELARYLRGELSLEDAITQAQQATRNYAKRQITWFRHQL